MPRRAHDPPYSVVAFDCDSTLASIEGVDELTTERPEVAALTAAAMEGRIPLDRVYGQRLAILQPTRDAVERVGAAYVAAAVAGAHEVVAALQTLDKRVAIVSGGLRAPILQLAASLGIEPADVHAVEISFDEAGAYAGFDEASPLARAGGKLDVLRELFPDGDVAFVGDGATDLEALDACARFVAYGGVVERAGIAQGADRAVGGRDFARLLPHLLAPGELDHLAKMPRFQELVERGRAGAE